MTVKSERDMYLENLPKGRCNPCKYAKVIIAAPSQFMFLGCYHEPYCGKWVRKIKDCPKDFYERVREDFDKSFKENEQMRDTKWKEPDV